MFSNSPAKDIICYYGQNGIYPSKHEKDSTIYDDSMLWDKTDQELRQICKFRPDLQVIHRPSNLSIRLQIS